MSVVKRGSIETIPEHAVELSENEARAMQWKTIKNWPNKSELWPFRYGVPILTVTTAISSIAVGLIFRRHLKLTKHGNFIMYFPTVVVPTSLLPGFHTALVTDPILLQNECPVCIEARSIILQNVASIFYPLLTIPMISFYLANHYATYRKLPEFRWKALPEFFSLYKTILRSSSKTIIGLMALNVVLAGYITNSEAKAVYSILKQISSKYEN